ncbi:anthranilate phosphoribosyltransferase [Mesoterricola sediminis]|uniref:Anthranilate phosphoribosyltransferase n=1 Tax=Mesoterricola sediminis TaxID=2927980 RepID=A0AA48H020_9BACT|nr:anthranilate phosphoribosyltransferase [Mesoterricola sediminis]BDU77177.1 anthranilate phosphoribosyltransferase [Mesoterricola sediminis]
MNPALEIKDDLTLEGARAFMEACLDPASDPGEVGRALLALNARPFRGEELTAFAQVLRARAVPFRAARPALDTCGTGGDARQGVHTANLSTLSALALARMGVDVVKHGSRSASSLCGSADLLEALGLDLARPVEAAEADLARTGFAFLFAPRFHPVLARMVPIRRALGVPTVFNMLGPLLNPARPPYQVLGVAQEAWILPVAEALAALGLARAFVVHGKDAGGAGMDEASLEGPTRVQAVRDGRVAEAAVFLPGDAGIRPGLAPAAADSLEACVALARGLAGGASDPAYSARVAEEVALQAALGLALVRDAGLGTLPDLVAEGREALRAGLDLPSLLSLAA